MKIPETFNIGPYEIPVIFKDGTWDKKKIATLEQQCILLQLPAMVRLSGCFDDERTKQDFFRKLAYKLLLYAGQYKLHTNEVLVEILGELFCQFIETKKGDVWKTWKQNSKIRQK